MNDMKCYSWMHESRDHNGKYFKTTIMSWVMVLQNDRDVPLVFYTTPIPRMEIWKIISISGSERKLEI